MNNSNPQNNFDESGRVPPQAIEVEKAVLGSCLIEDEALEITVGEINRNEEVFFLPAHRKIYNVLLDLKEKGAKLDLLGVETELRDRGQLAECGGSAELSELTRSVSSAANVDYHCQILLEKWTKREIILNNSNNISIAYDPESDPYDVLDSAMANLDKISDRLYSNKGMFASDMMEEVLRDIEHRRDNPGINGVPTGMPIDKYTGGWQDSNLYIIAARPSIGKSAFILKGAFAAALMKAERYRTNVFFWNGEMKNQDLIKRRLAVEAQVNYTKMRDGKVSDIEMQRLIEAAGHLFDSRVILDDTPGIGIYEFRAKYKTAVRRHNVGLGVVDYLQLMSGNNEGNREQEIASISRGLKAVAKETDTPIVALSQLSRACEKRPGAEPYLSDLRESGSIEQDADGVIMLNRPEFFGHEMFKTRPTKGKGIVKVEKMRNGMTGEFWMDFEKKYADWQSEYTDREGITNNGSDVLAPKAPIPQNLFEDDEEFEDDTPF